MNPLWFEELERRFPNENPLPTTEPKLWQPGKHQQDLPPAEGKAEPLKFSPADTLATLSGEWSFFSFAIPYIYLPFPVDPLNHFRAEKNNEFTTVFVQTSQPIFAGFVTPNGDSSWNHTLLGVPRDYFADWVAFCGTLAVCDYSRRYFGRVRPQQIHITDPIALHNANITVKLPEPVELVVFGAETNRGQIYTKPLPNHPTLWQITSDKDVSPELKSFSDRLFARNDTPYGDISPS